MNHVLIPTALAPPSLPRAAVVRDLAGATMGTRWSVRYAGAADPAALSAAIQARLARVVAEMSGWEATSDLCRFNRLPAGESLPLAEGFRTVLAAALATAAATDGAFDPTMGALVGLWGFGPQPAAHEGPPPEALIAAARACAGWQRLAFDAAGALVQPGGLVLDLNGIAKGFAVDLLAEALEEAGVTAYLAEIGGELRGLGVKPDGTPWWVALERPPEMPAEERFVVALHGLSVATSGDYRRCFTHAGRRYGHTLNPRTGWPADPSLAAVTVLHPSCMQADALATALGVMGAEAAIAHAARHGIAARLVVRDGAGRCAERLSPALAAMLD